MIFLSTFIKSYHGLTFLIVLLVSLRYTDQQDCVEKYRDDLADRQHGPSKRNCLS